MKIVVCIKQVPDSETKVVIKEGENWIDDTGVNYVINPYDEYALEEAIRIKEKQGGEVIVVSLGPDRTVNSIRTALAMGASSGIHIKANTMYHGLSAAKLLAETIKPLNPDLILLGKQAIDDDNMQIGPMVAELLNLPCVTVVSKLDIIPSTQDGGTAEREIEGGKEIIEFPLPAVITAQKGLNEPRYPSLKGMMLAKSKPITAVSRDTGAEIPSGITITSIEYPPKRQAGKIFSNGADAVPDVVRLLREEAKAI